MNKPFSYLLTLLTVRYGHAAGKIVGKKLRAFIGTPKAFPKPLNSEAVPA